ncbi:T-cell-specific guanine nucleotide triphosphate-binding protein 2-like [Mercenaria mercenaria]|uniref:T-cell-specific guanine nucleotide triphosphate-binding protein 2-like n=1 Tax=Mercenaria mercenaria TaxID=6596 RepID=UPI001E1D29EE|nr:T-cell-specific guanine nucleotide triphosphate-binding protein 2-like [Mercenaria mercenaria]
MEKDSLLFELSVNEDDAKEVKDHFEDNGYKGLKELLVKKRDQWVDVPIHVALSGTLGAGKSSFINNIRGIKADDKIGAALNYGQTTIEPIPYSHPNKHYLKFWDLPQLGSRAFTKDLYFKNIKADRYDYFLIFGKSTFTEDDFWFASQLYSLNKKFYFVCTHVDICVEKALEENKKSDPRDVQNKTLNTIREGLAKSVKDAKIKADYIYLITTSDVRKYDGPRLADAMIGDLSERKWEAMALTIHVYAKGVMQQKRRALQKRVWIIALMSGLENACHIYGLSFYLDLEPVIAEVQEYRRQFGLDDASILKIARSLDTTVESLKKASAFKTNYSQLADGGLLNQYKTLSVYDVADGITQSFSPILGGLISGNSSFGSTYYVLNRLLDMMETDALRMIEYVKYRSAEL